MDIWNARVEVAGERVDSAALPKYEDGVQQAFAKFAG